MATKNGYDKVKIFEPSLVRGVAEKHKTVMLKRVESGLDYRGQKFPGYSESYTELIGRRFNKKSGGAIKSLCRKAGRRQDN